MDFTINKYSDLLNAFIEGGYQFQTFEDYMSDPAGKVVILRHDVDKKPSNSVRLARIENKLGIRASYMFRIVPESNSKQAIEEIVSLGHEIGYHYEDLVRASRLRSKNREGTQLTTSRIKGSGKGAGLIHQNEIYALAYQMFIENLGYFRKYYPVNVISMHGNPLSRYDSRDLWRKYDYKKPGVICEPYFDIDYSNVLYITDTGRSWDGNRFNIRDRANNEHFLSEWKSNPLPGSFMKMTKDAINIQKKFRFRSTSNIINSARKGLLPNKVIINTHPQRWTDSMLPWVIELITQNLKNPVKYLLIHLRKDNHLGEITQYKRHSENKGLGTI
jgi:hypothetical protein